MTATMLRDAYFIVSASQLVVLWDPMSVNLLLIVTFMAYIWKSLPFIHV